MSVDYGEKFEKAIDYVLANERGYVFDKNDPGGETKYGISQKAYPSLNIKALSLDEAKKIYYCDYWLKGKFEQISDKNIATQLFDLSVNLGIQAATIVLQRALRAGGINVCEDGFIGSETLSGVSVLEPLVLLAAIKAEATGYYRTLAAQKPALQRYLDGWLNRAYRKIS